VTVSLAPSRRDTIEALVFVGGAELEMRLALLGSLLLLLAVVSLMVGPVSLGWSEVMSVFSDHTDDRAALILFELRLPRALLAMMTGAALACGGAVMQSLFRNPLAEPGLVGVSAGAALGAALMLVLGITAYWWLGIAGSVGAMCATWLAWSLARRWANSSGLLMAGIAINAMAFSLIGLLVSVASDQQIRSVAFWSLGSMTRVPLTVTLLLLPWVLACLLWIYRHWPALDALLLGEREALQVGVPVTRMRFALVAAMALMVGPLVALTGAISFVGLLVPQLLRSWVGSAHRTLLPTAALVGAAVVLVADMLCRVLVAPAELPIGVVISLAGAPLFFWLLRKGSSQGVS
jgi:iron complex transport system permease protein